MLFSRKWLSALKNTLLVDCIRILQAWGAYDRIEHNKKNPLNKRIIPADYSTSESHPMPG